MRSYVWGLVAISDAIGGACEEDLASWLSAALRNLFSPTSMPTPVKKDVTRVMKLKPNVAKPAALKIMPNVPLVNRESRNFAGLNSSAGFADFQAKRA